VSDKKMLEISHLSFTYPGQPEPALNDVSFSLKAGEFVTLCGASGCGKTTLLCQMKTVLTPHGLRSGTIRLNGKELDGMDLRKQSACIGFVRQNPDSQIVTDKVWHELAFGLESLGTDPSEIRGRVAEMASFFGIQDWFHRDVAQLSGGQKQLLNLASVMVMQPSLLILDEPASQLDPIAAADFLAAVGRINRELGVTVLITEHRLEEVFPLSDRAVILEKGAVLCQGTPCEVGGFLRARHHAMFRAMPTPMRIWAAVPGAGETCPVTVREGRSWLTAFAAEHPLQNDSAGKEALPEGEAVLELGGVWFRYGKEDPDVLRGLSLTVHRGELLAILGGNGTGKSTALTLMAGLNKPQRGTVKRTGTAGLLPQNPQTLFLKKTVREDLADGLRDGDLSDAECTRRMTSAVSLCRLTELLDRHPYDLSGGEQQRAALAKLLVRQPEILLLDEPTKGLDAEFKEMLAAILSALCRRGVTIVMVSHDIEFCAEYASRCALLFDGTIVTEGTPHGFFSTNSFYTTAASRMAREMLPEAVTVSDVIAACGGTLPEPPKVPEADMPLPPPPENPEETQKKLPRWRRWLAGAAGLAVLMVFLQAGGALHLPFLKSTGELYGTLIGALGMLALAIGGREKTAPASKNLPKQPLSKRTAAAACLILLLIPLTILFGVFQLGDRKYYFISLLVLLECMIPFFLIFEGRKPKARELVLIAVLCALGVAGRAAFFMLPEFKPVMAIVILAGVGLGGETGFLVGAVTMLVSNMIFAQGPWTPWQMFAMGIIGFLAGVLFRPGGLRRTRLSLTVFGALAAVAIYGGIMNPASALMWTRGINGRILLTYYAAGLPVDLIQAAATGFFLWFFAHPMLEKLERVKIKYGLAEPAESVQNQSEYDTKCNLK
jgi:energy-coupling factor transporter ATP-binding protein EcfA2/uncharacterized membrane protein